MKVERVISKVFNVDLSEVQDGLSRDAIEEWDSMGHVTLIMSLEEAFSVSIPIDGVMELDTVRKVKDALRRQGVEC